MRDVELLAPAVCVLAGLAIFPTVRRIVHVRSRVGAGAGAGAA